MSDVLLEKMRALSDKHDMLPAGSRIIAAVSGGADSVCLLHALKALSGERGFSLAAAHYNHRLRGAESDGDEEFTKTLCDSLSVPFYAGSGDVSGEAARTGRGVEDTARRMRYEFFSETAEKISAARIATAHTADDNAETVLMNLTRGGGARGLSGIPPTRGALIRPMLSVTRAEVEAYLEKNLLPHREDSSNASDDYTRNLIRHRVVPVLKSVNPAFCASVTHTSSLLREDDDYLCSLAETFVGDNYKNGRLPAAALLELPLPVASRAVRAICGAGLSVTHVDSVMALAKSSNPSARLSLPSLSVLREYGDLVFGAAEESAFTPVELSEGGTVRIPEPGLRISCKRSFFDANVHKSFNTFIFKCADICGTMQIRPKMSGDSAALGGGRTKSLKKLFIEKKLPARLRASVPVLADEAGVLAVSGFGQVTRSKVYNGDEIYIITIEDCERYE